jgi:hydroxyacylglutathione hydrolase
MLLRYFYDDHLAQASYMVGCPGTGEAIVIDPARDITPYLKAAEAEGMRIVQVTETHIHADYVSGTRELAAVTGAAVLLSDEGDENWKYGFEADRWLVDGDEWQLGNVKLRVLHTPGHTPEHLSFMLTDLATADEPIGVFTGDFLFVGDVGRPDLLEEAAGIADTAAPGARLQYQNIVTFRDLPDYLQIWPGHGAGSACGKALGAIPSTTLGYEKRYNPAFGFDDEDAFVEWLLADQPPAPSYFAQMKKVNKEGPALLTELPNPQPLDPQRVEEKIDEGMLVIDTRPAEVYAQGHIAGTLNIPAGERSFSTYAGWFVDFDQPTALIASDHQTEGLISQLRAVGVDHIVGCYPLSVTQGAGQTVTTITEPDTLEERLSQNGLTVLDVRNADEYEDGHLPGALNIPYGWVPRNLDEIGEGPVVVHCASGARSALAASVLERHGIEVIDFPPGFDGWKAAGKGYITE